jgi:hypothetical protein
MKILVADKFSEKHLAALSALGCEVDYQPSLKSEELFQVIAPFKMLDENRGIVQLMLCNYSGRPLIEHRCLRDIGLYLTALLAGISAQMRCV